MAAVKFTRLTAHAMSMLQRRGIALEWVEGTIRSPSVARVDEKDKNLMLAFSQIPAAGDKWLRVVYRLEEHTYVVVTAFFDRNQERRV